MLPSAVPSCHPSAACTESTDRFWTRLSCRSHPNTHQYYLTKCVVCLHQKFHLSYFSGSSFWRKVCLALKIPGHCTQVHPLFCWIWKFWVKSNPTFQITKVWWDFNSKECQLKCRLFWSVSQLSRRCFGVINLMCNDQFNVRAFLNSDFLVGHMFWKKILL